jgi:hypothetical protein
MKNRVFILAAAATLTLLALIYRYSGSAPIAAVAHASKSTASTTDQSATTQPGDSILPPEYAIFQSASPFGKGAGPGGTRHTGPEASFILCGIVQTGSVITAFVENAANKNVDRMVVGQSVARGHIKTIDLDSMEYESAGITRRIEVGQNFYGDMPQPAGPPPGPPGPPQMNGPTGPNQNPNMPPMMQMPPRRQRPG